MNAVKCVSMPTYYKHSNKKHFVYDSTNPVDALQNPHNNNQRIHLSWYWLVNSKYIFKKFIHSFDTVKKESNIEKKNESNKWIHILVLTKCLYLVKALMHLFKWYNRKYIWKPIKTKCHCNETNVKQKQNTNNGNIKISVSISMHIKV